MRHSFIRAILANLFVALVAGLVVALVAAPASRADTPLPAPLVAQRCNACHASTDALIGPPLLAVAARHRGDADRDLTVEVLAHKIVYGGAGNWGVVPMVPNDHVTLDQARALARLILALQP